VVGRVDVLVGVHPDDPDVATERDGLDAVLGLPSLRRPEAGTKTQEELRRLHPRRFGREEVARFVDHDEERDGDDHRQAAEHKTS
jgi:hypothetical protein